PERRGPNWTAAMVAAIVVVIGFVGFTMVNGGSARSYERGGGQAGGRAGERNVLPRRAPGGRGGGGSGGAVRRQGKAGCLRG
ncbi:hypothetical protein ABZ657_18765, partial [Streptomyces sp. NPDC007000]